MAKFSVDKVYEIWIDLERSYLKNGNGLSRTEFLYKYIGWNGKSSKLEKLKSQVMAEYTGNEEKVTKLTNLFDSLLRSDLANVGDITDLNQFLGEVIDKEAYSQNFVEKEMPYDFFYKLSPFRREENLVEVDAITNMIDMKNSSDVYRIEGNLVSGTRAISGEGVFIYKGVLQLEAIKEGFSKRDPFFSKVFALVSNLIKNKNMPSCVVFVDQSNYYVRGQKVFINATTGSKQSFPIIAKMEANDFTATVCSHVSEFGETPVYCV